MSWHGYSDAEVLERWDRQIWREDVACALNEIARDNDAAIEQRLEALQLLNYGMSAGLLPTDPLFPDIACQLMRYITRGQVRPSWFARRRRVKIARRLVGASWLLRTAANFLPQHDDPKRVRGLLS